MVLKADLKRIENGARWSERPHLLFKVIVLEPCGLPTRVAFV
jgi:hypothetical protein